MRTSRAGAARAKERRAGPSEARARRTLRNRGAHDPRAGRAPMPATAGR